MSFNSQPPMTTGKERGRQEVDNKLDHVKKEPQQTIKLDSIGKRYEFELFKSNSLIWCREEYKNGKRVK